MFDEKWRNPLLRSSYECPIIIAPTAFHCLAHEDGEIGTARGATESECIYSYNWMYSTKPEEEVLKTTGPKFLHVYLTMPEEILVRIVSSAEDKGYCGIIITCDHPTDRVRDHVLPLFEEASKTIDRQLEHSMPMPNMNVGDIVAKQDFSTGLITWNNIQSIKKLTKLPIICKGILSPIDAQLAIEHGANAIVVRFVSILISRYSRVINDLVIMVDDKLIQHHLQLNVWKIFSELSMDV